MISYSASRIIVLVNPAVILFDNHCMKKATSVPKITMTWLTTSWAHMPVSEFKTMHICECSSKEKWIYGKFTELYTLWISPTWNFFKQIGPNYCALKFHRGKHAKKAINGCLGHFVEFAILYLCTYVHKYIHTYTIYLNKVMIRAAFADVDHLTTC